MLWQVMNILDMLGCFHNCHNLFWQRVRFCISTCYKQKLLLHNCFWTQVSDFLFWHFCLILQLDTSVYSVTDQRWPQNVVRTRKWHMRPSQLYHCCSYYILTSPVIYYMATLHTINCFIYHKRQNFANCDLRKVIGRQFIVIKCNKLCKNTVYV